MNVAIVASTLVLFVLILWLLEFVIVLDGNYISNDFALLAAKKFDMFCKTNHLMYVAMFDTLLMITQPNWYKSSFKPIRKFEFVLKKEDVNFICNSTKELGLLGFEVKQKSFGLVLSFEGIKIKIYLLTEYENGYKMERENKTYSFPPEFLSQGRRHYIGNAACKHSQHVEMWGPEQPYNHLEEVYGSNWFELQTKNSFDNLYSFRSSRWYVVLVSFFVIIFPLIWIIRSLNINSSKIENTNLEEKNKPTKKFFSGAKIVIRNNSKMNFA